MEPMVNARHVKILIFAWLHGAKKKKKGYTFFPEKAYKILAVM